MAQRSEDSIRGAGDDEEDEDFMDGLEPEEDEWQDEYDDLGSKKKRTRQASAAGARGAKKSQKGGKWQSAFDESGKDLGEPKPEKKKRIPKPKMIQDPHLIKTSNRLLGGIINKDLYMDADESDSDNFLLSGNERDKLFGASLKGAH